MTTTTYSSSYAGEFSSDDDFESQNQNSSPQQQQQSKWSKFGQEDKASAEAIEQAIVDLKSLPIDSDFELSDVLIAGLLDRFKIPRGPIVDSTRKLYKKILLRSIKDETTNNANNNGTSSSDKQQNFEQLNGKKQPSINTNDVYSSDDDEPIILDPPNFYVTNESPMEIDTVETIQFRSTKLVESSSSSETEEDIEEDDEDEDVDDKQEDNDSRHDKHTETSSKKYGGSNITEMSSSTPLSKAPRLRKLAGTPQPKEDSFEEKQAKVVNLKRRPATRSQRTGVASSSSLSTKGPDGNQASHMTATKQDVVTPQPGRRLKGWHKVVLIIVLALVAYFVHIYLQRSRGINISKGLRGRLPIQFG